MKKTALTLVLLSTALALVLLPASSAAAVTPTSLDLSRRLARPPLRAASAPVARRHRQVSAAAGGAQPLRSPAALLSAGCRSLQGMPRPALQWFTSARGAPPGST